MLELSEKIPSLVKYMGSKSEIIKYVVKGLNEVYVDGNPICDLFAGSCTLAGALRNNRVHFISNDIQVYSSIFAKAYLSKYNWNEYPTVEEIINEVEEVVEDWKLLLKEFWDEFDYNKEYTLEIFNKLELMQQKIKNNEIFMGLINENKDLNKYHLFIKEYSGTYWSFRQCLWIDAFKCIADRYKTNEELYNLILACTTFAMAYNSQSTGHYAQFRKADKESSMNDILIYRRKTMKEFFVRKFNEIKQEVIDNKCTLDTYSLSFEECIEKLPQGTLVYADPPYCSVHYSRFYHILETFVKYDYPEIKFGGRYRTDRHQSSFCISTKVRDAFKVMFEQLSNKNCELVLSYSNSETCMIELENILLDAFNIYNRIELNEDIYLSIIKEYIKVQESSIINVVNNEMKEIDININNVFGEQRFEYNVSLKMFEHLHSTMGRTEERKKEVLEILVIIKRNI